MVSITTDILPVMSKSKGGLDFNRLVQGNEIQAMYSHFLGYATDETSCSSTLSVKQTSRLTEGKMDHKLE